MEFVTDPITGDDDGKAHGITSVKIDGTVVLVKKNVLDFKDFGASVLDRVSEFLDNRVSLQLVSATVGDRNLGGRGKVGKAANLENWITTVGSITPTETSYKVTFDWDPAFGTPGAVIVKNNHENEFLLKTITLNGVPGPKSRLHFVCNSWVYPVEKYTYDRLFFLNKTYLPGDMPPTLKPYREEELVNLRGDHVTGELKEWDRVYGYAYYNDLGNPDNGPDLARPVLGGSSEYPYPRRGRTSRPPAKTDPNTESRLPVLQSLDIYVPRDERFGLVKMSDFLAYNLKSLGQALLPALDTVTDDTKYEFDSLEDVLNLYEGGLQHIQIPELTQVFDSIPLELIRELLRRDGEQVLKFPVPQVIQANKFAWRTDEEFGREMLAGVNPVIISRLEVFPPTSKLDPSKYGNQNSKITESHITDSLDGFTVEQALQKRKLFILDHHDTLFPYLNRINSTANKIYATRTLLFLKDNGSLKPVAIELSLPHPDGDVHGCVSKVFTPAEGGVDGSIWQLAKAYAAVNDSGVHQLISHWLNTHAVMEPFVVATHRRLSVVHPIHKLLSPHYRDTMNINALARQILINAGGALEYTVFPARYAMEMSSAVYKSWKFTEQGLPADLLKRGVAVEDPTGKLRLLIEDYPYAVDGLAIWDAIETWVKDYCKIYYPSDEVVKTDEELKSWWKEIREVGHGDKKDETWWPKLDSVSDLNSVCTTIIWISSALHAAVNFGQYPYAGYLPNRPTLSRRFMPEPGTAEYENLETNPESVFLKTITSQLQTIIGVSLIEVLSRHSSDEVYLGQRDTPEWTFDEHALRAFEMFGKRLEKIERTIVEMNDDQSLRNRNGPVEVPYTLLYPNTSDISGTSGLTGRGIPNSVSI